MVGDPVSPGGEIVVHLSHEIADERLEVRKLGAVPERYDESELMGVAGAAFEELLAVGLVDRRVIEAARFSFPGDASCWT